MGENSTPFRFKLRKLIWRSTHVFHFEILGLIGGFFNLGIGFRELLYDPDDHLYTQAMLGLVSVHLGAGALFGASNTIINWPKIVKRDKKKISIGSAVICLFLGVICIGFGLKAKSEEEI